MGERFFKQTIRDIDIYRRTVLVRVDYNVPLKEDGSISDDLRIRASLPTLQYLIERRCKIIVISHLGRPKKRCQSLSLRPVAERLSELLKRPVRFVDDCVGVTVKRAVDQMSRGDVVLLENLRFYDEEEADDLTFAQSIQKAVRADYFVQEGFGIAHRSHASTHAITMCIPSVAGFLLEKEYMTITKTMSRPRRPFVVVIGGAKVSDKIGVIKQLIKKADAILIGGAMANAFLHYHGKEIGKSFFEPGQEAAIGEIYVAAQEKCGSEREVNDFLILPVDVAVANKQSSATRREVSVDNIGINDTVLDIGMRTIERFDELLSTAQTIVWNGPLGYSEANEFAVGSARVALAIAQNSKATSIIGGGDTADFILKWDGRDGASFTHVSTGGGASIQLMSGKKMPGVESLLDVHG